LRLDLRLRLGYTPDPARSSPIQRAFGPRRQAPDGLVEPAEDQKTLTVQCKLIDQYGLFYASFLAEIDPYPLIVK
jgi:hypothetical protein